MSTLDDSGSRAERDALARDISQARSQTTTRRHFGMWAPAPARRGVSCGRPMGRAGRLRSPTTSDRQANPALLRFAGLDPVPRGQARQDPKPSFLRTPSSPQHVIPSEAEGPETVACINGATRNHPRPVVGTGPASGCGETAEGVRVTVGRVINPLRCLPGPTGWR